MRDKLRILADWLKNAESGIDSYHDGHLEATFKRAKQETKQEIGDYLDEILNMNDKTTQSEINILESNSQIKENNLPF
jgi:hypothetical protein